MRAAIDLNATRSLASKRSSFIVLLGPHDTGDKAAIVKFNGIAILGMVF